MAVIFFVRVGCSKLLLQVMGLFASATMMLSISTIFYLLDMYINYITLSKFT